MTDLSGKRAIVSGATRGIGRGTAIELASTGAEVVVNYRVASDAEANEPLEESTIGKVALETTREAISIRPGSTESGQEGRTTRLQGTVLDFDEEPLADVKIRLEGKAFLHRELAFDQCEQGLVVRARHRFSEYRRLHADPHGGVPESAPRCARRARLAERARTSLPARS